MKQLALFLLPVLLLGASCNQRVDGGVFRSLDSGENWEQVNFVKMNGKTAVTISDLNILAMTFHPTDPNIIYIGTAGQGLYITLTGGESWIQSQQVNTGTINAIAVDPVDPNNVYVAQDTKVLKSSDQGVSWETVYSDVQGASITTVVVDNYEHNRVYAGTSAGTLLKSVDYGVNWDLRMQKGDGIKRIFIAKHDTRIIYVLNTDGYVYKTDNGGEPIPDETADTINSGWTLLLDKDFKQQFPGADKVDDMALDSNDSTIVFIVTRRGIMRGTDNGTTWSDIVTLIGADDKQNDDIRNVWTTPGNSNEIFFTLNNVVHKSVDAGVTWKVIENFPSVRKIYRYLIDPQTPNVMYAGMFKVEEQSGLLKQPK